MRLFKFIKYYFKNLGTPFMYPKKANKKWYNKRRIGFRMAYNMTIFQMSLI